MKTEQEESYDKARRAHARHTQSLAELMELDARIHEEREAWHESVRRYFRDSRICAELDWKLDYRNGILAYFEAVISPSTFEKLYEIMGFSYSNLLMFNGRVAVSAYLVSLMPNHYTLHLDLKQGTRGPVSALVHLWNEYGVHVDTGQVKQLIDDVIKQSLLPDGKELELLRRYQAEVFGSTESTSATFIVEAIVLSSNSTWSSLNLEAPMEVYPEGGGKPTRLLEFIDELLAEGKLPYYYTNVESVVILSVYQAGGKKVELA